uniref:Uncharacterized protein n=1 Tax=Manihot esculenta TaxID=3983 RepID=A0A2C9WF03_MANES
MPKFMFLLFYKFLQQTIFFIMVVMLKQDYGNLSYRSLSSMYHLT